MLKASLPLLDLELFLLPLPFFLLSLSLLSLQEQDLGQATIAASGRFHLFPANEVQQGYLRWELREFRKHSPIRSYRGLSKIRMFHFCR